MLTGSLRAAAILFFLSLAVAAAQQGDPYAMRPDGTPLATPASVEAPEIKTPPWPATDFERQTHRLHELTQPWDTLHPPAAQGRGIVSLNELQNPLSAQQAHQLETARQELREGNTSDGMRILKEAFTERGAKPYVYAILGTEYLRRGRLQLAVENLTQAARMLPGSGAIHSNLGQALCLAGRTQEGEREIRKANALDPKVPDGCVPPQ